MLFPVPSKILISLGKLGGYTNTKIYTQQTTGKSAVNGNKKAAQGTRIE